MFNHSSHDEFFIMTFKTSHDAINSIINFWYKDNTFRLNMQVICCFFIAHF